MLIKPPKRRILFQSLWSLLDNDLTTSAAAVSYFTMLAMFPTLLVMLVAVNYLFGWEAVEKYVIGQVLAFLPGAHSFVRSNLEAIYSVSTEVVVSCLLVMLWAASWVFTVIEKALNRVYAISPRSFVHGRVVNFAVLSFVWVLLGVSAILTAFVSGLKSAADTLPLNLGTDVSSLSGFMSQAALIAVSTVVTILLFTVMYKVLPNTDVPWLEALPGSIVAGVLWEGAKFGFAWLLPYFHYDLLYGSVGAVVVLLVWVYMSSLIMLFGAQFTALLHRQHLYEASIRTFSGPTDLAAAESAEEGAPRII